MLLAGLVGWVGFVLSMQAETSIIRVKVVR